MCNCVAQINKMIEGKNSKLKMAYGLSNNGSGFVQIATELILPPTSYPQAPNRPGTATVPALVVASFCPFCGVRCADQA